MSLDKPIPFSEPEALPNELTEAVCIECGTTEWIMPLDTPLDPIFLANYHCDGCEEAALKATPSEPFD